MIVNKRKATPLLALALSLAGCEYMGPKMHKKLPLPEATPMRAEDFVGTESENAPLNGKTRVEIFSGEEATVKPVATPDSSSQPKAKKGKGEYNLNFDDADLGEVAKVILGDILGQNYSISPQVSGKVTLQTSESLTREELLPTLDMLLSINNASLVNQAGMYLIKPSNEALYSSSFKVFGNSRLPGGYQLRVIPVKNVAASEMSEVLKPLLPEKALLHVDSNRNLLMVAGSGTDLMRVQDVVSTFDIDILKGRSFALYSLANVDAGKVIDELQQIFARKSGGEGKDKAEVDSFFRFIEIERLNAILAITHQPRYLNDIETWVNRLDKTDSAAGGGVYVYRCQHVSAPELAETLSNIFGTVGSTKRSRSTSIAAGHKSVTASNKASGASTSSSGSSSSSSGGTSKMTLDPKSNESSALSSGLSGSGSTSDEHKNLKIIADEGNNALIIVGSAQEQALVQRTIKQLDVLPLQVVVDTTIVSVTLTDELKYGIQWYLNHENGGNNQAASGTGLEKTIADVAAGVATGGFSYMFTSGSGDIRAVLNAEANDNKINVLSSPSLMVLNNQEASIQVGDKVPIRTSQSTNTSGNTSDINNLIQTSSIAMQETGITLSVRPRVNASGLVLMDIVQNVDEAVATKISNIDSPTISQRQIKSSVAVQNGETIVLGGLISEKDKAEQFGIPILHQIPFLGPLFGSTSKSKDKTELVILLTPRVIKSREDAQQITSEFKRKLSNIYEDAAVNVSR